MPLITARSPIPSRQMSRWCPAGNLPPCTTAWDCRRCRGDPRRCRLIRVRHEEETVRCGWSGALPAPGIRTIREMRSRSCRPCVRGKRPLYYMYRDLARSEVDRRWLSAHQLRYDITVIPPRDLCGEHVKTKGHYHPVDPVGTGYPELYEVVEGTAQFLLQTRTLDDVILVFAGTGAVMVIPPGTAISPSIPRRTPRL